MRPKRPGITLGLSIALALTITECAHAQRLLGRHEETERIRREAVRLEAEGKYLDALPLFDQYLARKPRDIRAITRRGAIYLRLDQPERALAEFDRAIRINPTYPSPYNDRGEAYIMLGRYGDALREFRAAQYAYQNALGSTLGFGPSFGANPGLGVGGTVGLGIGVDYGKLPGLAVAHCGTGQVYHRTGRDDLAIKEYDQSLEYYRLAIKQWPDDPARVKGPAFAYTGRAEALAALGRLDEATADFDRALQVDPKFSRALGGRASVLAELGLTDRARADFDGALKLDPNDRRARSRRASLNARDGRPEQALADFDAVLDRHPNDPLARKSRAAVLIAKGDYERALKDLDEAIRIDPTLAPAYLNRGAALNGLRRFDLALKDLDEAVRLDPKDPAAYNNRGLAHWGLGRADAAIRDFDESLRLDPGNVVALLNRGGAHAFLRHADLAARDFDAAAAIDPRNAAARRGLDEALAALGRPDPNSADADLSLRLDPKDPAEFCRRGNLRRSRGDLDGALADFAEALRLDPKYAAARAYRGWARLVADRDGADDDARAYLALTGPRDPSAAYNALLGHFAARRAGRADDARLFLDSALVNAPPDAWPYPALRYLDRGLKEDQLLASARGDGERAEALVVIGLSLSQSGAPRAAAGHLRRALELAAPGTLAHDLAVATLRRIEPAGRPRSPRGDSAE